MKLTYAQRLEKRVNNPENEKTILNFVNHSVATGISNRRIDRYLDALTPLSNEVGKSFKKMTKQDIQGYVKNLIEREDYKDWTKYTYQVIIKNCFFPWLYETEKPYYPEVVRWMKPKVPDRNNKQPDDMITEEETKKMIAAAKHPRDKALVAFLFESGARIGEVMNLKIKDVRFNGQVTQVTLNGKTGMRHIPIINSGVYLSQWINQHPRKDNPENAVFCSIGSRNHENDISYAGFRRIINIAAETAEVSKNVNPHNFRHSQATLLAGKLKEPQLRMYMGWSGDSKMVNTYVHLSSTQLTDAILEVNGMKKTENNNENKLKPIKCLRCGEVNGVDSRICSHCGQPFDTKSALEHNKMNDEFNKRLEELKDFKNEIDKMIDEAVERKIDKMGLEKSKM